MTPDTDPEAIALGPNPSLRATIRGRRRDGRGGPGTQLAAEPAPIARGAPAGRGVPRGGEGRQRVATRLLREYPLTRLSDLSGA